MISSIASFILRQHQRLCTKRRLALMWWLSSIGAVWLWVQAIVQVLAR